MGGVSGRGRRSGMRTVTWPERITRSDGLEGEWPVLAPRLGEFSRTRMSPGVVLDGWLVTVVGGARAAAMALAGGGPARWCTASDLPPGPGTITVSSSLTGSQEGFLMRLALGETVLRLVAAALVAGLIWIGPMADDLEVFLVLAVRW